MKFLKRAAAVGMSVAMLGMTAAGALAADLADYPGPFIANDAFVSTAMVIGSTDDSAARSDINTYLSGKATAVGGDVSVSGGKTESFVIGAKFNDGTAFGTGLTDTHLSTLIDSKVSWGDTTFDMMEKINFTADMKVTVSGNASSNEDFAADPYIVVDGENDLAYWYIFDGTGGFNESKSSSINVSTSNPLEITFLGKSLEITELATDSVTINMADKYSVAEGDSLTVDGYTVEVGSIFSASVEVSYGGDTQLISDDSTHDFGPISVKVEDIGQNTNNPELSKAIVYVGAKITDTITSGNAFEMFTDYDPDGDAPWEWDVVSGTSNLYRIGVENALNIDDIDDDDADMDPVTVGGSIVFPNNFAAISFDEVTNDDYASFEITTTTTVDLNTSLSNQVALQFKSLDGTYMQVGGVETDTVYVTNVTDFSANASTWDVWYVDDEGVKIDSSKGDFKILYDSTDLNVSFTSGDDGNDNDAKVVIAKDGDGADNSLVIGNFTVQYGFGRIGSTEDYDSTRTELYYDSVTIGSIGGRDYDFRTPDGLIVQSPEANLDLDKVLLKVPNDIQKATVTVSAEVAAGGSGTEAALMTDDEVTTASDYNLILVGGPCVNSLTASFLGLAEGSCGAASGFSEGQAYLKLKDNGDKVALIVAGWDMDGTKRAAKVMANPDSFTLSGTDMMVTGDSLEVSGITVA